MSLPKDKFSATPFPEMPKQEGMEEDSLQFLWAVSYCDLLMVLMSFFILFFQVTDTAPQSSLKNVILSLKGAASAPVADARLAGPASYQLIPPVALEKLTEGLETEHVTIVQNRMGKSIVLDFSDNLYGPRGYAFPLNEQAHLEKILERIKPYSKSLLITFIGHADEKRIVHGSGDVIDSNLILSNLRAARAVEIAIRLGFDPKGVVGQGAGEFSRNTRSLSIQITDRGSP